MPSFLTVYNITINLLVIEQDQKVWHSGYIQVRKNVGVQLYLKIQTTGKCTTGPKNLL